MKAIHNVLLQLRYTENVVINHKTTKFESNSQQYSIACSMPSCCYQSQNYKIWKQFTTVKPFACYTVMLLSITKLQNLKAIHNRCGRDLRGGAGCYQSQNYKIWKEFTTSEVSKSLQLMLLSITKLQNLKAIHNCQPCSI